MRAVAALLVVYYHAALQAGIIWPTQFNLIAFGKCGVDLFFVLSGYLMWQSTRGRQYNVLTFYEKRLFRIAPLYWVLTLLASAIALAVPSVLRSTRFDVPHLIASLLFVPWPNPARHGSLTDLMTPVIVPGWTLNFEMLFYGLFGLALIGPVHGRLLRMAALFTFAIVTVYVLAPRSLSIGFYDPFLILEFLLGIVVAIVSSRMHDRRTDLDWVILVAASFLLIALDVSELPQSRFFLSGIPAALIVYSLVRIETNGRWPPMPWLTIVGDASYSLYLTHVFVITGLRIVFEPVKDSGFVLVKGLFVLAALALSVCTALITYKFIEHPLGRFASKLPNIGQIQARRFAKS